MLLINKNLFGPSENPLFSLDPDCWHQNEKVTQIENEKLTEPFTEEEVKNVVLTMDKNTAPGPHHIPIEFYQSCWEIIKADIMDIFFEFFSHQMDIGRLNYGVISFNS